MGNEACRVKRLGRHSRATSELTGTPWTSLQRSDSQPFESDRCNKVTAKEF